MKVRTLATFAVCCGAAAPVAAQSLSRVDIIALQQQLRDDGCGISHVSGRIDAVTRHAIQQCSSKYNASSSTPAAVLTAMNIGYTPGASSGAMGGTLGNPNVPVPSTPSTPTTPDVPSTPVPNMPAPSTPTPNAPPTPNTPPQ